MEQKWLSSEFSTENGGSISKKSKFSEKGGRNAFYKNLMAKIRKNNRNSLGPYLARADTIHAKALNMFKSIGFEVKIEVALIVPD